MNTPRDTPQPAKPKTPGPPKQWPWRFVLLITTLAVGIAYVSYARNAGGDDRIKWRYSYNQAVIEAEENDKPLLVYFTADWCGPCKQMKTWVFSDKSVAESIELAFVPVKVDLSSEGLPDQYLADKYNVTGIPTLLTLTTTGSPISISSGSMTKDQLMAWLDTATERYAELANMLADDSATAFVEEGQED